MSWPGLLCDTCSIKMLQLYKSCMHRYGCFLGHLRNKEAIQIFSYMNDIINPRINSPVHCALCHRHYTV